MVTRLLTKIVGTKHDRDMKLLRPMVEQINSLEDKMKSLPDLQLQAKTPELKEKLSQGASTEHILPEAFAVCREASRRVIGMRHYDVQLIGGLILQRGAIAEMKTGEGKTLVATLPIYLNALTGRGAHLVTVNDYLARRDNEWMGQVYNWLGLSTGTILHNLSDRERKAAYGADITYGTNNEFGFDYLRDNMKFAIEDYVQRELHYAIVDECDSILIDEARTPLIISGPKDDSVQKYYEVNKLIPHLKLDVHFTMEEKSKTASLTDEGNSKIEELLKVDNLYDPEHIDLLHHIYQALKAHHLFSLDVDYMIKEGEIVIVDEFTGRLMPGRRWSDGLHQAIEAKEGVKVKNENQTLASITFQNYFRMYEKLAGMTGTAETEAAEFKKIYNLDVVVVPTNKPIRRKDEEDVVYKSEKAKYNAIAEDIVERQKKGQPVLVGTVSIQKSEKVSRALKEKGISHSVLNAKHHEREAEIVAQAGSKGAITIATNMAGRGTDILLGGNPEFLARRDPTWEGASEEKRLEIIKSYQDRCAEEKQQVLEAGGLYIVGTERHESRRIDNQLRGRSGRQGDPGESRFYLSLEDDLMRIFNGERIQKIMNTLNVPDDEPITARMVTRAIENAQKKVEGHQFDVRKHLLEYDDVMNQQRKSIYGIRRQILKGENVERIVLDMLGDSTSQILDLYVREGSKVQDWDIDSLQAAIRRHFALDLSLREHLSEGGLDSITRTVSEAVKRVYDHQKTSLSPHFEQVAKMILLQTIDMRWKDHLQQIDRLKEGIHLRGFAQKDPLIEYKKEAFSTFEEMNTSIYLESIEKLLRIQLVSPEQVERIERQRKFDDSHFDYEGTEEDSANIGWQETIAPAVQASRQSNDFVSQPQESSPQELNFGPSSGRSRPQSPKLNREQRRRLKKKR